MLARHLFRTLLALPLLAGSAFSQAAEFTLAVQPIHNERNTLRSFQPLADYLSTNTGHTIRLVTSNNFFSYWVRMRRGEYDLAIDAAHFTDYKIRNMQYVPLAKIEDTVSYSVVVGPDTAILDLEELAGHRVATLGAPSLGMIRAQELFPNLMREPNWIESTSASDAVEMVLNGKVLAAIVPTPVAAANPDLNIVTTTEPTPHIALSGKRELPTELRRKISNLLIGAQNSVAGQKMLSDTRLPAFEAAPAELYKGYAELLTRDRVALASPLAN